jgi:hypothetical protein
MGMEFSWKMQKLNNRLLREWSWHTSKFQQKLNFKTHVSFPGIKVKFSDMVGQRLWQDFLSCQGGVVVAGILAMKILSLKSNPG